MRIKRKNQEMKDRLLKERDLLLRERDAIENKILGLERAIALIADDHASESGNHGGRRTATKSVILDLLRDVGTTGLNAIAAVDLANARGVTLDKASVSSLLSRLKKDEIVTYDGDKYRLKEFSVAQGSPPMREGGGTVIGLPRRA
ncbi:MAG: hypothetical protein ACLPN5_14150 [Roseiarcus sp.]